MIFISLVSIPALVSMCLYIYIYIYMDQTDNLLF